MSCLYYPLRRAKLVHFTNFAPVEYVETRWSSVVTMLRRYIKMRDYLGKLDIEKLDNLLLSKKEDL